MGVLWVKTYQSPNTLDILDLSPYEKKYLADHLDQKEENKVLLIRPTADGDFSKYVLRLIDSTIENVPPPKFDPILSEIDFSFKIDCPSDFDCLYNDLCNPEKSPEPIIDYMAKDYQSFRQIMLDRMSLTISEWKERNPADMGIVLVELLAYVGDQLSYYQDAVASEAYLGTARKRISIKRHARLLDYTMHDGCNARSWVYITVDKGTDALVVPKSTKLLTGRVDERTIIKQENFDTALEESIVFETMQMIKPFIMNLMNFIFIHGVILNVIFQRAQPALL